VLRTVLAEHDLVIGEVILVELRRALRGKLGLPDDRIAIVEAILTTVTVIPKPSTPAAIEIRDPDDRWVVATAVAGEAEVLVTGDHDLLQAASHAPLAIVSPRAFWEMLRTTGE
jgi:putative PIN family toxin of toxin-antitoxin system